MIAALRPGAARDAVAGVALVGLAGTVLVGGRRLAVSQEGSGFGPGALPAVVGVALLGLGVALLVTAGRAVAAGPHRTRAAVVPSAPADWRRPLGVMVATAGYGAALPWIGFLAGTVLYALLVARVLGERRWRVALAFALAFGVVTEVVFAGFLGVQVPGAAVLPGVGR